jgi:hypothetical protein
MMMAHDSSPDTPELSEASVTALRSALIEYVSSNDASALDRALRLIAAEAREKQMHAERLLVALKDVWFSLPEHRESIDIEQQMRLLQRAVTVCIRAYYGG